MAGGKGISAAAVCGLMKSSIFNMPSVTQRSSVYPNFGHQKLFPDALIYKDIGAK